MAAQEEMEYGGLCLQWRAMVVVDVVESVRLIQADEVDVIRRWRDFVREVREEVLPAHGGRLVKSLGDGMLLEFESVPNAIASALGIQDRIRKYNDKRDTATHLLLRLGAHTAEIVIDDLDIFGKGVNLTARLAALAEPGQIVVSAEFAERLIPGVDADLDDLGECYVKHLDEPVHAFRLTRVGPINAAPAVTVAAPSTLLPPPPGLDLQSPRIAVLPFLQGLGAHTSIGIGDLVGDAISHRLAAASSVRIISRLSCQVLGGRCLSAVEVGQVLSADYVVSGRCNGQADRLFVQIELAESRAGQVMWSDRLQTSLDELLSMDDAFSQAVAETLMRVIMESELRRSIHQPLPQLSGYMLQQTATHLMHRSTQREFEQSRKMLDHLVERYPRSPSPHAWMADWHVLSVTKGFVQANADVAARALDHTRKALAADPDCALALAIEGFVHCHINSDLETAGRRLQEALVANTNEAVAWLFMSVVEGFKGDGDAAWRSAQRALSLSPLDPQKHYFQSLAASAALAACRHGEAISLALDSLRINRSHLPTLRALTIAQVESGDLDAARRSAQRILAVAPAFNTQRYLSAAPKGGEEGRARYARALQEAGIPKH